LASTIVKEAEDLPFPELRAVFSYWRAQRGAHFAPSWDEIDMMTFPPAILPKCLAIDAIPDSLDFRFRYWGTGFTELHGYDLTGKLLSDISLDGAVEVLQEQYQEVMEHRLPRMSVNRLLTEKNLRIKNTSVRLPLSTDRQTVDKLISLVVSNFDRDSRGSASRRATAYVVSE